MVTTDNLQEATNKMIDEIKVDAEGALPEILSQPTYTIWRQRVLEDGTIVRVCCIIGIQ